MELMEKEVKISLRNRNQTDFISLSLAYVRKLREDTQCRVLLVGQACQWSLYRRTVVLLLLCVVFVLF